MRLIIFLLIAILITPTVYAQFPTTFVTLSVVDENNEPIKGLSLVHVQVIQEDVLFENYTITIFELNQNVTVPWTADYRPVGTQVILIASSEGYKNSEPFVFEIPDDIPNEDLLFPHTFILTKLGSTTVIEVNEITESLTFLDNNFDIHIATTSEIQEFIFDPDITSLIFTLEESNSNGFLNVTIPKSLMGGPFRILIDDFLGSFARYEDDDFITIETNYLSGSHTIIIKSQTMFQPELVIPTLTLDISDTKIKSDEVVAISGTLLPIQAQASVILEITTPDEIIFRTINVLSDGSFEYKFTPMLEGRWNVFATYDFDGEIIKSNIIIFSIDPSPEPEESPEIIIEPEPEPKPEEPEPEQPLQPEKQIEVEEDQDLPDESDETRQVFDNYLFIVLILILAVIIFAAITKQDKLKPYFQKNRIPDKKP